MKTLMGVLLAMSLVWGLALTHGTGNAQPPGQTREGKQLICHVTGNAGAHIIEVADPAVPAHLRNHGDCLINSTNRALIGEPCDPTDANNNDVCDIQP